MKKDGGPAFPFKCQGPTTAPEFYYGMTLRDYFAATVRLPTEMITEVNCLDDDDLLNRFGTEEEKENGFRLIIGQPNLIRNIELRHSLEARARARLRYAEADAMIAEREKEEI